MEKILRFKEFSAYKYNLISQGNIILYLYYKINISNLKSPTLGQTPFYPPSEPGSESGTITTGWGMRTETRKKKGWNRKTKDKAQTLWEKSQKLMTYSSTIYKHIECKNGSGEETVHHGKSPSSLSLHWQTHLSGFSDWMLSIMNQPVFSVWLKAIHTWNISYSWYKL